MGRIQLLSDWLGKGFLVLFCTKDRTHDLTLAMQALCCSAIAPAPKGFLVKYISFYLNEVFF